jgi:predicted transcriptional regulator
MAKTKPRTIKESYVIDEVAKELGVSPSYIRKHTRETPKERLLVKNMKCKIKNDIATITANVVTG